MTTLTRTDSHTTMPARPRPQRSARATAREARKRRSFDGLLASYIRELAAGADPAPRPEAR
jgi:hypothetical protein